jgi:hypothetical protein
VSGQSELWKAAGDWIVLSHWDMILSCDISIVYKNVNDETKSKHNYDAVASFVKQMTCFGPCTWPSSGLSLCVRGDYTVCVFLIRQFITGSTRSHYYRSTAVFVKL